MVAITISFGDSMRQAARSLSDERREYIASILTNSLSVEGIELGPVKVFVKNSRRNDIEVICLQFYVVPTIRGDMEFRQKHANILYLYFSELRGQKIGFKGSVKSCL